MNAFTESVLENLSAGQAGKHRRPAYRSGRRPDVVLFVDGLPLAWSRMIPRSPVAAR